MDNERRIKVFTETLGVCNTNPLLSKAIRESIRDQIIYLGMPDSRVESAPRRWLSTKVEVTPQKTFEAAKDYAQTRVAALNFADYYVPGGRVWEGSRAQEECLCRVSTLYPCISASWAKEEFYKAHIGSGPEYSDDLIYTPGVVVFREDDEPNHTMSYDEWFVCDVITCAAPYNIDNQFTTNKQYTLFRKRFECIIETAATNKVDTLVLGAFGCGAFGNDPKAVAKACYDAIENMAGKVGRIILAVYSGKGDGGRNDSPNYLAFKKQFDKTMFIRSE